MLKKLWERSWFEKSMGDNVHGEVIDDDGFYDFHEELGFFRAWTDLAIRIS